MRRGPVSGILLLAIASSCGEPRSGDARTGPEPTERSEGRYEATAFVLQRDGDPAMLCLGVILDSLPPQCGTVPIPNWDWDGVEGEERLSGTTWGEYHVVGTYDGSAFTLAEAGPPVPRPVETGDAFAAPCPEPDGGWTAAEPGRTSDADLDAAGRLASGEPDYAGHWIDHLLDDPGEVPFGPDDIVLVAAFTGDLDRHRAELAAAWGGPLCVTRHERTEAELRRIQGELAEDGAAAFGLQVLVASTNIMENQVEISVVVEDDGMQPALDARYGEGTVRLIPALTPVA